MDRPRKRPPCGSRQDEIQGNMDTLTGQSTGPPPPPGEQVSSDVKFCGGVFLLMLDGCL